MTVARTTEVQIIMHDSLITYLNSQLVTELSDEEIEIIKNTFKPKKLRKHQYLLQQGEVSKVFGFITKGAIKQYAIDDAGKENILCLHIENWWAGDRESFLNDTPSPYNIDAYEDTELLVVTKEEYVKHLSDQRFISEFFKILTERQAFMLLKKLHDTKIQTAEQRLADLEKESPELIQRFPQHIIASYLGMTKETLSRIRNSSVKK